jgi:hypothetical protein
MTFYTAQAIPIPAPPNNDTIVTTSGINLNAYIAGYVSVFSAQGTSEGFIWTNSGAIAVSVPVPTGASPG